MNTRHSYDRQMRGGPRHAYDRSFRGARGYGRGYGRRYDRGAGLELGRYGTPFPGAEGYPSARWGWGPIGWAAWDPMLGLGTEPMPGMLGYGYGAPAPTPRRSPEESRSYGRGGDRELQRWARRYGYDLEYEIRPRRAPGR